MRTNYASLAGDREVHSVCWAGLVTLLADATTWGPAVAVVACALRPRLSQWGRDHRYGLTRRARLRRRDRAIEDGFEPVDWTHYARVASAGRGERARAQRTLTTAVRSPPAPYPWRVPSIHDREWVERRLREGASIKALAAEAGTTARTVRLWLARHEIEPPDPERARPSDDALRVLYREVRSVAGVATQLRVAENTAYRWLVEARVRLAHPGRRRADIDVERLRHRRREGASIGELSAEFGVSVSTVRRRLDERS